MEKTIRSAFITDLLLPFPHSLPSLTPDQISTIGYDAAVSLLHSPEAFIRSNPLVTDVRPLDSPSDSKSYMDVPHWCSIFNLNHAGEPERGVSDQWQQFEITDKLNWGLGSSDIVYVTAMRRIPGGFESVTSPGNGVKIYGRFEILRPNELGKLTSTPTNITSAEPGLVSASEQRPQSRSKADRDYTAGAPNVVPGWPEDPSTGNGKAVDDASTGLIHYIEHNETRCNALLSLYIKATTAKSHRTMHENFKRRWGDLVKDALMVEAKKSGGTVVGHELPRSRGREDGGLGPGKVVGSGERKAGGLAGEGVDNR